MAGATVRKAVEYFFAEIAQLPDGNPIRKLAFSDHNRRSKIAPFTLNRASGFMTTDRHGRTTFICGKSTRVDVPSDDVLHVAEASTSDAIKDALNHANGRWLKPLIGRCS